MVPPGQARARSLAGSAFVSAPALIGVWSNLATRQASDI